MLNNIVTLEFGLEVTQDHSKRYYFKFGIRVMWPIATTFCFRMHNVIEMGHSTAELRQTVFLNFG